MGEEGNACTHIAGIIARSGEKVVGRRVDERWESGVGHS